MKINRKINASESVICGAKDSREWSFDSCIWNDFLENYQIRIHTFTSVDNGHTYTQINYTRKIKIKAFSSDEYLTLNPKFNVYV